MTSGRSTAMPSAAIRRSCSRPMRLRLAASWHRAASIVPGPTIGKMVRRRGSDGDSHPQWPDLPLAAWRDTFATLHLWTQIVGKIRLARTTWLNHSWHATLYVTSRGLTTSPIPYESRTFELEFDFTAHRLELRSSDGRRDEVPLRPQTVAVFYHASDGGIGTARSAREDQP